MRFGAAALVLLLPGVAGAAQAQTPIELVGNIGQPHHGFGSLYSRDHAQAFTTGSNAAGYKVTSVDLAFHVTNNSTTPTYTVTIRSDSSSSPGTSLGTLANPASLQHGVNSFTSSAGIDLEADKTYWVVVDVSVRSSTPPNLSTTQSDTESGESGWSIANGEVYRTYTSTGSWTVDSVSSLRVAIHGYEKLGPVRFVSGFRPLRLEPDAEMTPETLPAATDGGGAPYTYSLTSEPAGLAGLEFDATTRELSGTPEAGGPWTFTYTADDDGNDNTAPARLTFRVTVGAAFEEQQQAVRRTLAAVAARTVAGALSNIGTRLDDAVPPAGLALAGRHIPFGGSGAAGFDGYSPGGGESRGMEAGDLLGSGAFSLALGAAEDGKDPGPEALRWGVWGRGDYGAFEGRAGAGVRYKGDTRTGWLGADARSGRWVAGLAVSRGTSETDYALEGEKGRIETALTALWPYGRWTFANGLELRGLAGAGRGTARHVPEGDAPRETSRLTMRAGSLGVRQAFAPLDGFDLAARADASFARMETGRGEEAVDGLRADAWRLRGGLEASSAASRCRRTAPRCRPFAELAARRDGGDGVRAAASSLRAACATRRRGFRSRRAGAGLRRIRRRGCGNGG